MKLYCATTNPGKLREFRQTLRPPLEVEILPGLAAIPVCDETGATFEENAIQKALYYSQALDRQGIDESLFAEDSGLEVDALAGAPGIYSARFSGAGATDESNNRMLIERLRGIENRTARYVCVIALARHCRILGTFRGEVEGKIALEPRGTNGFGYDPLFFYPPFGCTFGEAPNEDKLKISHRAHALSSLCRYTQPKEN